MLFSKSVVGDTIVLAQFEIRSGAILAQFFELRQF
jgi:hypothetical protein